MIRYRIGMIIWSVFAAIFLITFISILCLKDRTDIIPIGVLLGITVLGMTFNIVKYHKTKRLKENTRHPDTQFVSPVSGCQSQNKEQTTVYIESDHTIFRADGKPISDEEVPYLMEIGYKNALEREKSRSKLSARDEELQFQFMQKHGTESQKYCDKFEDLNRFAYEENDLNLKIELLQQAIMAFEKAKQWHYKHSKGARIYFENFWERLHNSKSDCFSWIDSVKENLDFQLQKRDKIIPWIIDNSKNGFLQTEIYKEFTENSKGELRLIIDELAEKSIITKIKKGNSYFIIHL